jgi:hypothetical protein
MRSAHVAVFTLLALAPTLPAFAQSIDLPRPSPGAKITQTVGLTDISVEYSSPGVKGRVIWGKGKVVPYGEVWRAGANATTKVTFSKPVTIGTTSVPAGSYAYFVIPNEQGPWTVILNTDYAQGGAFAYTKDKDVVRVDVTPEAIPSRERLVYVVSNFTNDTASLDLEWEKVRLSLPIKLDTDNQVAANIKTAEDNQWSTYNNIANYERLIKQDNETALAFAGKSIKIKETWQNFWQKAQILAAMGKKKEAIAALQKAQSLGGTGAPRFFKDESAELMTQLQGK